MLEAFLWCCVGGVLTLVDRQHPKRLVGVCDNSKGDETDAEGDIDTALHIDRVLSRDVLLHDLTKYNPE